MKYRLLILGFCLGFRIFGQASIDDTEPYKIACGKAFHFANSQVRDSMLYFVERALEKGISLEYFLTGEFGDLPMPPYLKQDILDCIKKEHFKRNEIALNKLLAFELWNMWIEDQRFRTFKREGEKRDPKKLMLQQKEREKRLERVFAEHGWPTYSIVGREASDATFFILQHANPDLIKKYLPLFINAAKDGEASLPLAATMVDRYLTLEYGVQIYGTQVFVDFENAAYQKGTRQLVPILDEENLLANRKAAGLGDFMESCKRLKVSYIPIKDRPDYRSKKVKKKWLKKGYLFRSIFN